ncbi:MAG: hypothetical protein M3P39_01620 [Actinomycetota bacterium]|nr:hypothetical protein [Actinomycetota bacterium]
MSGRLAATLARRPLPRLVGLVAVALALALVPLTLTSDHWGERANWAVLGPLLGLSFVGAGLFAWERQRGLRVGALMVAVGVCALVAQLEVADADLLFTVGLAFDGVYVALVAHLLLAYPDGRLRSRGHRGLAAGAYAVCGLNLPVLAVADPARAIPACACPQKLLLVQRDDGLHELLHDVQQLTGALLACAVVLVLVRRFRRPGGRERPPSPPCSSRVR